MRPDFAETYPDRATAFCTREQAAQLLPWDHHRVIVAGRPGVLFTLPWMEPTIEQQPLPLELLVVFHYADSHPEAPPEVQAQVDELHWRPERSYRPPEDTA